MSLTLGTFVALSDAAMYAWSLWDCIFIIIVCIAFVFILAFVMGERGCTWCERGVNARAGRARQPVLRSAWPSAAAGMTS